MQQKLSGLGTAYSFGEQAFKLIIIDSGIQTAMDSPFPQSQFPESKLNIAFIAQNSKEIRSDSISLSERNDEISKVVSVSQSQSLLGEFSPLISNMGEWPSEIPDIFEVPKKVMTRAAYRAADRTSLYSEQSNEIQKLQRCHKKRLGEKMKVIKIKVEPEGFSNSSKRLRSKSKTKSYPDSMNHDSSSDQIRQIVNEMTGKNKYQREIKTIKDGRKMEDQ